MIKALIFDCYGVLLGRGFNRTYETAGGDPLKDRLFIEGVLGAVNLGLMSEDDFQRTMAERLHITLEEWQAAERHAEQPDTELLEYIKQFRKNYKTAILSNASSGAMAYKLGADVLEACFDTVVVSADVGLVKPDPRIYEYAAGRLDVETPECVFIDDHQIFLDAARELGMKTVLYQSFGQFKADLVRHLR